MNKFTLLIAFLGVLSFVHGQTKLFPAIKDYGGVYDVPFAKDKPDSLMKYKIIIEANPNIEKPEEIYAPLEHISRMYNLHIYSGIPQKSFPNQT